MNTVTIPKQLSQKGDLVLISRQEYEALLKRQKIVPVGKLTPSEKLALERSRKEMAKGAFVTLEALEYELGIAYRKKR